MLHVSGIVYFPLCSAKFHQFMSSDISLVGFVRRSCSTWQLRNKYNLQAFVALLMKSFGATLYKTALHWKLSSNTHRHDLNACDLLLHNSSAMPEFLITWLECLYHDQTKGTWETLLTNWKSPVLGRSHGQFTKLGKFARKSGQLHFITKTDMKSVCVLSR